MSNTQPHKRTLCILVLYKRILWVFQACLGNILFPWRIPQTPGHLKQVICRIMRTLRRKRAQKHTYLKKT